MYKLPLDIELYTIETLKKLSDVNFKIGELKGILNQLPNPEILLNAITLGEAKDSSEIENIITTYDELYKEMANPSSSFGAAKEVLRYHRAIMTGYNYIKENGFISIRLIKDIQNEIEINKSGIRKLPGTVIKNTRTGEIIYTPPQSETEIHDYLSNLEQYINLNNEYDPLINMGVIHYQFEAIHPFYDGNGRTGRVINILYLVMKSKISYPVLYLSRYIIRNKEQYYKLLQESEHDIYKIIEFVQYMLQGIKETAEFTIDFINEIVKSMDATTKKMKEVLPKLYSNDLVEYLYSNFYTKNELFKDEFGITRQTASIRLKELEKSGFLYSEQIGKETIYINVALMELMNKW